MKLISYLSNGYPTIEDSKKMAKTYVDAGCDIIEIDFPSHNPYLESDYIKERMAAALCECDDYEKYMQGMVETKNSLPNTTFILMVYENTITEIGYERFSKFCLENGFLDMILVGISDEIIKNKLISDGIRVSCYVQFDMQEKEIEYAKKSNGFVYMQGKPYEGQATEAFPTLASCISHLRSEGIEAPIYCGVGIHAPEDAAMAKAAGADAVFIGSAILKLHNDIPALTKKMQEFKAEC